MHTPAWEEALPEPATATAQSWIMGYHLPTGNVYIALDNGQRIDFPPEFAGHIAAAMAEFIEDESERAFVVENWR